MQARRSERDVDRGVANAARRDVPLARCRKAPGPRAGCVGAMTTLANARQRGRSAPLAFTRAVERGARQRGEARRIEAPHRSLHGEFVRLVQRHACRPIERSRRGARAKPRDVDALVRDHRRERERQVAVANVAVDRLPLRRCIGAYSSRQARRHEFRGEPREVEVRHRQRETCGAIRFGEYDAPVAAQAAAIGERRVDRVELQRVLARARSAPPAVRSARAAYRWDPARRSRARARPRRRRLAGRTRGAGVHAYAAAMRRTMRHRRRQDPRLPTRTAPLRTVWQPPAATASPRAASLWPRCRCGRAGRRALRRRARRQAVRRRRSSPCPRRSAARAHRPRHSRAAGRSPR